MRVLILGGSSFLASGMISRLQNQGHQIAIGARNKTYIARRFPEAEFIDIDFAIAQNEAAWILALQNIDILINCVGVYHTRHDATNWQVHYEAPKVVFLSAQKAGVKKIIQISALGIDKVDIAYGQSKLAAEKYLQQLSIPSVILRPSFVYGPGSYGGSSLFRGLAGMPWLVPLANGGTHQSQPIHVDDLAKVVVVCVEKDMGDKLLMDAVGPETISIKKMLKTFRTWLGFKTAKYFPYPRWLLKVTCKIGDWLSFPVINSTSYAMLLNDNLTNAQEQSRFFTTIGFRPRFFTQGLLSTPSYVQDRWHARLYFLKPCLRLSLALLWIVTGIVSTFFSFPNTMKLLQQMQVPTYFQTPLLYGLNTLDFVLGLALLFNYRVLVVGSIQFIMVLGYTVVISCLLPSAWLDPFGQILKNIPILAATAVIIATEGKR